MKPLLYKIFPWIIDTFHFPRLQFLQHFYGGQKPRGMPRVPSAVALGDSTKRSSVKYDVDIPIKFTVYCLMGWIVADPLPRFFEVLNIL